MWPLQFRSQWRDQRAMVVSERKYGDALVGCMHVCVQDASLLRGFWRQAAAFFRDIQSRILRPFAGDIIHGTGLFMVIYIL